MTKILISKLKETSKNPIWRMAPSTCIFCGEPLYVTDDLMHMGCTNPDCDSRVGRRIEIMAKALGIDNIGIKVAAEISTREDINSPLDIFNLPKEGFIGICGWKEAMAEKVYNEIHKDLSNTPFDKFIRACQIKRVGDGSAKELARICPTIDKLLSITSTELAASGVKAFGKDSSAMIVSYINTHRETIQKLYSIVYPNGRQEQVTSSQITTDTLINAVVTGSLSIPRKQFQEMYSEKGIKFQSDVSSTTNVLVCNSPSSSSKSKKAKQFGIPIMTEEEFKEFVSR